MIVPFVVATDIKPKNFHRLKQRHGERLQRTTEAEKTGGDDGGIYLVWGMWLVAVCPQQCFVVSTGMTEI